MKTRNQILDEIEEIMGDLDSYEWWDGYLESEEADGVDVGEFLKEVGKVLREARDAVSNLKNGS